jgi:hypothetical protein
MYAQTSFQVLKQEGKKVLVKTKNSWRFSRLYLVEKFCLFSPINVVR